MPISAVNANNIFNSKRNDMLLCHSATKLTIIYFTASYLESNQSLSLTFGKPSLSATKLLSDSDT